MWRCSGFAILAELSLCSLVAARVLAPVLPLEEENSSHPIAPLHHINRTTFCPLSAVLS